MQDLITIENESVRTVFVKKDGLEPHLAKVKEFVDKYSTLDMSDKKQRAELKTRVTYITSVKTALKKTGDDLARDIKKEPKLVDASRKKGQDFLTEVITDLRKPLTEWEAADKERKDAIELRIESMSGLFNPDDIEIADSASIKLKVDELEGIDVDDSFQELKDDAEYTKSRVLNKLYKAFDGRKKWEDDQAELEELRKAKIERDAKEAKAKAEQDAKDAAEAEEQRLALLAAEAETKRLADIETAKEAARVEAEQNAQAELDAARVATERAEQARLDAEQGLIDAQAQADREIAEAEQRAIDAAAHAEAQAQRVKDELAEEQRKREANTKHKGKINREAMADIIALGVGEALAKKIVTAIAQKKVNHISVQY